MGKSGKPWPRFTLWCFSLSSENSAKTDGSVRPMRTDARGDMTDDCGRSASVGSASKIDDLDRRDALPAPRGAPQRDAARAARVTRCMAAAFLFSTTVCCRKQAQRSSLAAESDPPPSAPAAGRRRGWTAPTCAPSAFVARPEELRASSRRGARGHVDEDGGDRVYIRGSRAAADLAWGGANLPGRLPDAGDLGDGRLVGDAAGVGVELEADVAVLAPAGGPGVADEPVGLLGLGIVADELDAVVDVDLGGRAGVGAEDAAGVVVPGRGVEADGDGRGVGDGGELVEVLVLAEAGAAGVRGEGVALDRRV